jgi:hypothetical protein
MRDDITIQVSDRRLTRVDGTLHDDSANKAVCIACRNAAFSVAYTGLARVQNRRTDIWLADYFTASNAGSKGYPELMQDWQRAASSAFRNLGPHRRVTFSMVGFCPRGPFAAHLSNFEDSDGSPLTTIDDDFRTGYWVRNSEPLKKLAFSVYGTDQSISETIRDTAVPKIRKAFISATEEQLTTLFVQLIRGAAEHPRFGHVIGRDCMSVICDPIGNFRAKYHPDKLSSTIYSPHFITSGFSAKKIWVSGQPLSDQSERNNGHT